MNHWDQFEFPRAVPGPSKSGRLATPFSRWLLHDTVQPVGPERAETTATGHSWWKVMCLTGVDYFSTLSYLPAIAVLIKIVDPSEFREVLRVTGTEMEGFRVLRAESPAVPNAIAAIPIALRDVTGERPHAYFEWSEGSPLLHMVRYLLLGRGDTAPVVREILRETDKDPLDRPVIHVGG